MDMSTSALAAIGPTSTRPLAGKAAIVTGSTSGIGLGIARALAEAGANLMLERLRRGHGHRDACATSWRRSTASRCAIRRPT